MKKHILYTTLFFMGIVLGLPVHNIQADTNSNAFNVYMSQHMKEKAFQEAKAKMTPEEFHKWAQEQYNKEKEMHKKPSAQMSTDYNDLALDPFGLNL